MANQTVCLIECTLVSVLSCSLHPALCIIVCSVCALFTIIYNKNVLLSLKRYDLRKAETTDGSILRANIIY